MIGRRADDAQSFDEAWSGRTPRDEQIAQLVRFAETLCESAVAEPTPEFRLSLRSTLMAEAQTVLVPIESPVSIDSRARRITAAPTQQHPVRRRIAGLTAAALTSVGVIGMVSSSASAVPGDMLYSVKRSVESVQLALHHGDESRGAFLLSQASERLAEARQLSDHPSPRTDALIADTLDDFSSQAESGSNSLFDEFDSNGKEQSIQKVNDFAASAATELATLSTLVPESAETAFASAAQTVSDLAIEASTLCSSCASADAQSLVNAITALSDPGPVVDTEPASSSDKPATEQKPSTSTVTGGAAAPTPVPVPAAPAPSATIQPSPSAVSSGATPAPIVPLPSPTTPPPIDLSPVTEPLLDGLLGDDGLVPGLLNGLLSGGN
ncbi:MAG: DUF5667 domain-containing protein [Aeromicrobium sp.]